MIWKRQPKSTSKDAEQSGAEWHGRVFRAKVCVPVQHRTWSRSNQVQAEFPPSRHRLALACLQGSSSNSSGESQTIILTEPDQGIRLSVSLFRWGASASGLGYLGSLGRGALWRVLVFSPPPSPITVLKQTRF